MLSLQEISDRLEIQDLVFRYADLIDRRQIQRLRDEVFTADAHIGSQFFNNPCRQVQQIQLPDITQSRDKNDLLAIWRPFRQPHSI